MTKTTYFVAASLDGFIADAEGKLDWLTQFDGAEGVREHYEAFLATVGALAMGARTYEYLLDAGLASWPYARLCTWVFTHRRLPVPAGANVHFCARSVEEVHADIVLAAHGKDVWLMGGGQLAAQFATHGLLDELRLGLAPVILGAGTPLLPGLVPCLSLEGITSFGAGFVELKYRVVRALG